MKNFFHQLKAIFIRDYKLALSYKMRFIYNIGFIFIQILIFYYLSKFFVLSNENNLSISSLDIFQYFIIGVCLLDISYALISSPQFRLKNSRRLAFLRICTYYP